MIRRVSFVFALLTGSAFSTVFGAAAPHRAAPTAKPGMALEVQVLLDWAGFSPGEIDGRMGGNTKRALAAFQGASGLPRSSRADAATRAALRLAPGTALGGAATAEILTSYTLTADDLRGPFVAVPDDMMERSRLETLGYASVQEEIAERFHASPDLLRRLNPGVRFAGGSTIRVPNVQPTTTSAKTTLHAAEVVVSKSANSAEARDDTGHIIFFAPVTSGSEHDPLPLGDWKVKGVAKNPPFSYNPDLFWDGAPEHTKATLAPGPNNPVGLVWIDLDKEHYGLHGTAEPAKVGHSESHGCVRLTNWDAQRLAALVQPGTAVRFVP